MVKKCNFTQQNIELTERFPVGIRRDSSCQWKITLTVISSEPPYNEFPRLYRNDCHFTVHSLLS